MAIPTEKAYEMLNLPLGASKDAIEQSYKKLAFKWHPEKFTTNKNTQEALKKFKQINIAYRKLIYNERDAKDITLHEMFEQYRQVFHSDSNKKKNAQTILEIKNGWTNNKNNSLIEVNNNISFNKINNNGGKTDDFKIKNAPKLKFSSDKNNNNDEENYENQYQTLRKDEQIDQNIAAKLKAKSLALKGNDLAKQNEFEKAIEKFTEAIKYDNSDHRLYGNRSYCYDKLNKFQEALVDSEKAISLEPTWPKGYYRKGRSLFGLKMYKDAEQAYEKVLEFENTNELDEELYKVRALQLQEMGFSKAQSEMEIKNHITVQAALEAIFYKNNNDNNKINETSSDLDETEFDFLNDNESENENFVTSYNDKKSLANKSKLSNLHIKTDKLNTNNFNSSCGSSSSSSSNTSQNSNSESMWNESVQHVSTSLWIGNVDPSVEEETLIEMFSAFGELANVRCLPEKYCAFVNFKLKEDAQKAMQNLQGKSLEGQRLLIKYPDNPNTVLLSSLVAKNQNNKTSETKKNVHEQVMKKKSDSDHVLSQNKNSDQNGAKLTGPVNGNECYFWRTTGCLYADKCRYEHIKKNKGLDKKPWHK